MPPDGTKHGNDKMYKHILVSFFVILLTACSQQQDCFVADTVEKVKELKIDNKRYFIYARVTGLQEKEVFYELYSEQPKFDECGKANLPVVSEVHLDKTEAKAAALIVNNKKLELVYNNNKNSTVDYKNIEIVIR